MKQEPTSSPAATSGGQGENPPRSRGGGRQRSGQQIVLALETDTFTDLRPRVERCEPPVHVAVYRPSALAAPQLHFLVLEPASPGFDPGGDVVDPESTVGAFCTRQDRSVPARWQPHLVLRELAGV